MTTTQDTAKGSRELPFLAPRALLQSKKAPRSSRPEVRNPMLADPEIVAESVELQRQHPAAAAALVRMLKRCSRRWRAQADHSWAKHKAPVAAYHKANAVNARHLAIVGDKAREGHLA